MKTQKTDSNQSQPRHKTEAGLTVIELIVVITVVAILTPLVLGSLGGLYSANVSTLGQSTQSTNTVSVLRAIQGELRYGDGWTTSLSVGVPLGPTNNTVTPETWSYCGLNGSSDCSVTANRVLIAYTNATDKAPTASSRLPVFDGTTGDCDNVDPSNIIQVAQIYFVAADTSNPSQNDLYRRTVVNPYGDTACNGVTPYQTTTCAPSVTSQPGCKDSNNKTHTDAVLLTNVSSFNVDYYSSSNDSSAIDDEYNADPDMIAGTQTIEITVTTQTLINGALTPSTDSIRISRMN